MGRDHRMPLALAEGFSFCEAVYASPRSPWHIRKLTKTGPKYGGGIDSKFLCRAEHINGWDIRVDITEHHLAHSCPQCRDEFEEQTGYKLPEI